MKTNLKTAFLNFRHAALQSRQVLASPGTSTAALQDGTSRSAPAESEPASLGTQISQEILPVATKKPGHREKDKPCAIPIQTPVGGAGVTVADHEGRKRGEDKSRGPTFLSKTRSEAPLQALKGACAIDVRDGGLWSLGINRTGSWHPAPSTPIRGASSARTTPLEAFHLDQLPASWLISQGASVRTPRIIVRCSVISVLDRPSKYDIDPPAF
ncbi:hypothetical protein CMUS01_03656 [Colletotrichum musicola]|uniref:Uncharacterized protein n=1 Tax=Colletotrichum musicola TaxID=2175873 RepID=A0A8H6NR67_9PEZI|nr:hypothetical protein CMUS01_03656 [Colletotrichum musicola]